MSTIELLSRGVILLLVERRHRSPDHLPVLATLLHVLFLLSGFYDKNAQLLGQCQLDLRLLAQRGREADLRGVVSSFTTQVCTIIMFLALPLRRETLEHAGYASLIS